MHVSTCMHVCMYMYMYVYVCVHPYVHVCMYNNLAKSGAIEIQQLQFSGWPAFEHWKQKEEDATYTSYIKGQQSYSPQLEGKCPDV